TINDLDEFNVSIPTDSDAAVNEVDENVIVGTTVGLTANAFDLDATNNTITYSLTSNPGGLFQIDANTGIVTTAAAIDRETHGASRLITVQASSSDGSTATQNFTIAINDLDEFNVTLPLDANASSNSVAENATVGTVVGITGFAEDLDATNNTITYTLDDDAGGRFSIDANSGVVAVAGTLDYELNISHSIRIRATSTDGSSATQAFTVSVTNVNEGGVGLISDVNATANTVVENSVAGTTVGVTAWATDPDSVDTVSYSLDDSASGRFAIDSNTGAVTTAGAIDREMAGSYNITIRATSSDGSFSTLTLAIAITDVNEYSIGPISDTDLANNSVDENASIGSSVGVTAQATDNDATNNAVTYSLIDDDGGRFAIDANSGILTVAATIDREIQGPSRSITVRAISADGSYVDQTLIISINDVDEFDVSLPADTDASANFVSENSTLGTAVGIDVDAIDDDATMNAVVYSLANDDGGRFAIDSVSGIVTVAGLIDRELDGAVRTIVVRADSADGSFSTASFQITIGELNDHSPIIISNGGSAVGFVNVSENNIVVTDVDATDGDLPGQPLTYSIAGGADAARFTINSLTGELQLLQTADYESPSDGDRDNTYEIMVRVEDVHGLSDTQALYVSIINVNESPVAVADSYQGTVAQKMVRSAADGLLANDSDIDGDPMTVVLVSGPASGTLLVNADGSFEFTPTPGFSGDMSFRYYVTDGALDSSAVDVILSIASVGPPPVDPIDSSEEDQEENEESDSESNEATTQLRGLGLQVVLSQSEQAKANFNDVEDYNEVEDANGNRDSGLFASATSKLNGPTGGISPVGIEENPFRNIGLTNAQLKRLASHPERMFKFDSELSPAQFEYLLESFAKELLLREHSIQLVSGLATAVFVGAATGGALWLAGGSYLAATLYSSLPVWARFDPIFVLQNNQARKLDDDLTLIDLINEESVNHETIDENEEAKS
ncbi:MAG: cadherin domain-containing protein, partial [Pirellulaceae bacterium]